MFSTVLEYLIFVASIFLFAFACIVVLVVSYGRARRKGYRPPGATLIILAGCVIGIIATVIRNPPNSTSYRFFVDFFWLPLLFSTAATAILIVVLPRRTLRTFGSRQFKFPFVEVGKAIIGGTILLFAVCLFLALSGKAESHVGGDAIKLAAILVPTGLYLIRRGRRLKTAPSFEESLIQDPRPPVLYIRAFKQEKQYFVLGTKSEYGAYAKTWHAAAGEDEQKIGITFEEYLSDAVESSLGPFVALGSPEDYLPPEGAMRMYAKDEDWMERFDQFARRAACILVEMGKSENLRWEFEHLRSEGLQQKLFVVTRHSTEGSRLGWAFLALLWRLGGIPQVTWQSFSVDLAKLGYEVGADDPGPGSVITFDAKGRGIVLTTHADLPAEFVEPIQNWVTAPEKVTPWRPFSCSSCGRRIYVPPDPTGEVRRWLCQDCNWESTASDRAWLRIAPAAWVLLGILSLVAVLVALGLWVPETAWPMRHLGWTMLATVAFDITAYFAVAAMYYRRVARKLLGQERRSAQAGDAAAMLQLGIMYSRGRKGLRKDEVQAVSWYHKAAEAGTATAMANLGVMYMQGRGVPADPAKAVDWYRKAAATGSALGMNNLGVAYLSGSGGLPKDDVLAVSWFRRAAEAGNAVGMLNLGMMYERGEGGLPKDARQSITWYEKAAQLGDADARTSLKRLQLGHK